MKTDRARRPSDAAGYAKPYTGLKTFQDASEEQIKAHMERVEAEMVRMERKTLQDMGHDASHVHGIEDVMWH